jgi:hypothetical protein
VNKRTNCLITTVKKHTPRPKEKYEDVRIVAYLKGVESKCVYEDRKLLWGSHRIHMAARIKQTHAILIFYLITDSYISLSYITNYINKISAVLFCSL